MRTTVKLLHHVVLALGLLVFAQTVPSAAAEPTIRVRVGEHPDFHRIVFDWPAPVAYRVQQNQGRTLLIFEAPANLDLSLYHRNPPSMIRNLTVARVGGGASARFEIPVNARLKHAAWGNKVVIDILKPVGGALVWSAQPPAATQTTRTAAPTATQTAPSAAPSAAAAASAAPEPVAAAESKKAKSPEKQARLKVEAPAKTAVKSRPEPALVVEAPPPETKTEIRYVDRTRRFSFGPNASTLGIGAEAGYLINNFVGVRLVGNYLPSEFEIEADDVRYDAELDWKSVGGVIDVYPFGGGFRVTGGARYNSAQVDLDARPTSDVQIGGQTFTPSEVGTIRGDLEYSRFAPYAGLGWEERWFDGRLGFAFDLGVYYQGDASVDASASGSLGNDPNFQQALDRETRELEDDLNLLSWYPVVGVSVTLRF